MVTSKTSGLFRERRVKEGPRISSPDSVIVPLSSEDSVPMVPKSTVRSPLDMANPGFSAAPRATGYQLSAGNADQPWRSDTLPADARVDRTIRQRRR